MPERPDDIQRGSDILASWLNASKNAQPRRILGGNGILATQSGEDLIISLAGVSPGTLANSSGWWAEITANNGSGRYSFKRLQPDGSGGLTDASPAYTSDYAYDVAETDQVLVGTKVRVMLGGLDSSNNPVFYFDSRIGSVDSPTDLTVSGEGTLAADTTEWNISDGTPVTLTVQTRTYFDDTAETPILYGYSRDLTFNTAGQLVSVSGETRYEIDSPEDCS